MSILSQIGVVVLIIGIVLILIRSDKELIKAAGEGEHFVDEWALREERKLLLIEAKKEAAAQREHEEKSSGSEGDEEFTGSGRDEEFASACDDGESVIPGENRKFPGPEEGYTGSRKNGPGLSDYCGQLVLTLLDEERIPIRRIPVKRYPYHIGREYGNDLVLDDLCVAKKHCRIVERNGSLVMEDGGSRNKIMADGCPRREILLKDGLLVEIGSMEFLVEIKDG